MILAIDVGNTNTVIGGFSDDKLVFVSRISTVSSATKDEYAMRISAALTLHGIKKDAIDGAIISSVVPPLNSTVSLAVKLVYGVDAILVGPGIKTGLNIHCDTPSSVGADLISAAVGAKNIYGAPALIIDMGTATKIMLIDSSGSFVGVSILPGVKIALKALTDNTAQLPQISLDVPTSVIGKNTQDSMRSGAIFGTASAVDGMIDRIILEFGKDLPCIATGGLASVIIPFCRHNIVTDEHLVLKGLNTIYSKNKR
jgi:type III pantothenate kinase